MGIQPRNIAAKGTGCSCRTLVRAARSTRSVQSRKC